ncbi:MAG: 1-acyl-sn-glycerol-3-phosphate acyltransferase [Clostridia bacterium]|nr:1-acyl-sn-glycerol-3-phosphate acyltransferase [Clostridia bacterium]
MGNGLYNVVWFLCRGFFDIVYPSRVTGMENLPAEGGFILCLNHCSGFDPLYISAQMPRKRNMHFLAKKELFSNKLLAAIIRGIGGIPIDRGNADLNAVRTSLQLVKEGKGLGIFPQGTRSRDNTPTPMLPGASMIALRAGVPVIPAYIDGPYKPFRRMKMMISAPLDFSDFGRRCDRDTMQAATDRIASAIWNMQAECRKNKPKT